MSSSPHRHAWCAALVAAVALAACSSGSSGKATPTTTTPNARVKVTPGLVSVASAGAPVQLPDADRDAVFAAVAGYVNDATIAPLEGKPVADLPSHFTTAAAPALQGPERDALLDTDVPRATGRVTPTLQPVSLKGLADPAGTISLVGSTLDLTVRTTTAQGPVTIHRSGELMFVRDGGAWKITSFKLAVTRDGAGIGTATATSSTTQAAP
jgi:hypothetical protein